MKKFKVTVYVAFCVLGLSLVSSARTQGDCSGGQIFIKPTCLGDTPSSEEERLYENVNRYRTANGRPAIKISNALNMLANRRMLDLNQNMKSLTHSWSNCPHDIRDEKTWTCVTDAPKRLNSGYKGRGYETLYRTAKGAASADAAIEAWKKSSLHSSIILNHGIFLNMPWDEVGVAIDGQYAALWFGFPDEDPVVDSETQNGLGVSYDQAITGLAKLFSIHETPLTIQTSSWRGTSADKEVVLEFRGTRKEIVEAVLGVTVRIGSGGKFDPAKKVLLATLLKNLFADWNDIDAWIDNAVDTIIRDPTAWKKKVIRKIMVDLRAGGFNSLRLSMKPQL